MRDRCVQIALGSGNRAVSTIAGVNAGAEDQAGQRTGGDGTAGARDRQRSNPPQRLPDSDGPGRAPVGSLCGGDLQLELQSRGSAPGAKTEPLLADPDSPPTMADKEDEEAAPTEQGSSDAATAFEKAWGRAVEEEEEEGGGEKRPLNELTG